MTTKISQIDQQIDAIHSELERLEKIDPLSAASWQDAWNKHPDLRERETELYRQRGIAQQERDAKANKDWAAQQRRERREQAKRVKQLAYTKCPTCGCHTLQA